MKCTLAEVRNERNSCLDAFALIEVIVIVIFHLGCLSVYVIYFWILCGVLSSFLFYRFALYNHFVIMNITMIMMVFIIISLFRLKEKVGATHG